MILDAE
jgi:hypothetical protein